MQISLVPLGPLTASEHISALTCPKINISARYPSVKKFPWGTTVGHAICQLGIRVIVRLPEPPSLKCTHGTGANEAFVLRRFESCRRQYQDMLSTSLGLGIRGLLHGALRPDAENLAKFSQILVNFLDLQSLPKSLVVSGSGIQIQNLRTVHLTQTIMRCLLLLKLQSASKSGTGSPCLPPCLGPTISWLLLG